MKLYITRSAVSDLGELPLHTQNRIIDKIKFYAEQENPLTFAKYITERKSYRFRVGNYRALFDVRDSNIYITSIKRRDKAYK
jgi:mRNA interferase RelE/StbE